jgi:hypothetical protein
MYHYIYADANEANGDCVYKFLLERYQPKIKKLTIENLLKLFKEPNRYTGVSPLQLQVFCSKYNIAMYCLDLKMKPFFKFTPLKRNHNIDALIFVCAHQHMFPVLDELSNCNVIYTETSCLLGIVKYLFLSEQTIFFTKSYNGCIVKISYRMFISIS